MRAHGYWLTAVSKLSAGCESANRRSISQGGALQDHL